MYMQQLPLRPPLLPAEMCVQEVQHHYPQYRTTMRDTVTRVRAWRTALHLKRRLMRAARVTEKMVAMALERGEE